MEGRLAEPFEIEHGRYQHRQADRERDQQPGQPFPDERCRRNEVIAYRAPIPGETTNSSGIPPPLPQQEDREPGWLRVLHEPGGARGEHDGGMEDHQPGHHERPEDVEFPPLAGGEYGGLRATVMGPSDSSLSHGGDAGFTISVTVLFLLPFLVVMDGIQRAGGGRWDPCWLRSWLRHPTQGARMAAQALLSVGRMTWRIRCRPKAARRNASMRGQESRWAGVFSARRFGGASAFTGSPALDSGADVAGRLRACAGMHTTVTAAAARASAAVTAKAERNLRRARRAGGPCSRPAVRAAAMAEATARPGGAADLLGGVDQAGGQAGVGWLDVDCGGDEVADHGQPERGGDEQEAGQQVASEARGGGQADEQHLGGGECQHPGGQHDSHAGLVTGAWASPEDAIIPVATTRNARPVLMAG